MRIHTMLAGAAAAALMAFPALAQDGQYGEQLNRIMTEAAAGTCSVALMGPAVLEACTRQIATMGPGLRSLGPVESMSFVRAEETPGGRVETWSVKYAGGLTLTWLIGQMKDGKFDTVGTGAAS